MSFCRKVINIRRDFEPGVCLVHAQNFINAFSFFTSAVPKRDPYIEGNKHKYSPGEVVELNCTSNSSDPEADLFWYINALPVSKHNIQVYKQNHFSNYILGHCNYINE